MNQIRLRFDGAYGLDKPRRAEFFWAWPPPFGRGSNDPESNVDYQRFAVLLEKQLRDDLSAFVELPGLLSNPEIGDNSGGTGDLVAGVKWAFLYEPFQVAALQLKVQTPLGDEDRGLGTGNLVLEPGALFYRETESGVTWEGELRCVLPVDGAVGRAGPVLRYGVGGSFPVYDECCWQVRPVIEAVGWTVINGRTEYVSGPGAPLVSESADGDTIVNLKVGARVITPGMGSLYAGYGRALTDERWYSDIFRAEWRYRF